jgi:hypothetical protein
LKSLRADFRIDAVAVEQKPLPGARHYRDLYLELIGE